jgi:hypothetical protein
MTAIHEINQLIYVETPHGEGIALFIIDYGHQANTIWIVSLLNDGSLKHYDSNQIKLSINYTLNLNIKK